MLAQAPGVQVFRELLFALALFPRLLVYAELAFQLQALGVFAEITALTVVLPKVAGVMAGFAERHAAALCLGPGSRFGVFAPPGLPSFAAAARHESVQTAFVLALQTAWPNDSGDVEGPILHEVA